MCAAYIPENQQLWPSSESLATEKLVQHGYQKLLKTAQKNTCAKLQQYAEKNTDAFLSRIITTNDTWVYQYDPLMKRKSPESHHQLSQHEKKKFMVPTSLGKVMSGTTKESCYWNSWREVSQSIQSSTCTCSRS
jgi:hypothetical protein